MKGSVLGSVHKPTLTTAGKMRRCGGAECGCGNGWTTG